MGGDPLDKPAGTQGPAGMENVRFEPANFHKLPEAPLIPEQYTVVDMRNYKVLSEKQGEVSPESKANYSELRKKTKKKKKKKTQKIRVDTNNSRGIFCAA